MKLLMFLATSLLILVGIAVSQEIDCPVSDDICSCTVDEFDEDIIDCSSRGLTAVPVFNVSDYDWGTLILSDNSLGQITELAFDGLKVRKITADTAGITGLEEGAFIGLEDSLEELDLTDNNLNQDTMSAIRDLPRLGSLTLDYNDISSLSEAHFINLPALTKLVLQFNDFTEVYPEYVANIPTLTHYDLYGNNINFIHNDSFSSLGQLIHLNLGINQLPVVPTFPFRDLIVLEYLSLWANDISEFAEDALSTLPETLEILYLGLNPVSEMPENLLVNLPNLFYLDLDLMLLSSLPDNFLINQVNIYQFTVSGNNFDHIPRTVGDLPSLIYYYSSDNRVTSVQGDEFGNSNQGLLSLYLGNNDISYVNQSLFCNNPDMNRIELQDNNIQAFESCGAIVTSGPFDKVSLDLSGNPLHCGCDILWLFERSMIENLDTTFCQTPEALAGRSLSTIQPEEFQCDLGFVDVCLGVCRNV